MTVTATDDGVLQAEFLERESEGTASGGRWVTHRASGVLLCSALLFGGTGTTALPTGEMFAPRSVMPVTVSGGRQTTTLGFVPQAEPAAMAPRLRREGDDVRWLHEASGLTWEHLGRVFGVSRRAVHLWASGARMNAVNAEAVFALAELVRSSPGTSPDERRSWLLRAQDQGGSILERFRQERLRGVQINRPALRAADVIDTPSTLEVTES